MKNILEKIEKNRIFETFSKEHDKKIIFTLHKHKKSTKFAFINILFHYKYTTHSFPVTSISHFFLNLKSCFENIESKS